VSAHRGEAHRKPLNLHRPQPSVISHMHRCLVLVLLSVLLMLVGSNDSLASVRTVAHSGETPTVYGPLAQSMERDDGIGAESRAPITTGYHFFDDVVRLMRENYVHELSDEDIFLTPIEKMTFTMLPQCVEDVQFSPECSSNPQRCFLDFIRGISSRCKYSREQLLTMALNAVLSSLDPNSGLLDADMMKELTIGTSGKFGGVGMVVTRRDGDYVVISPFEGGPAYKAGIQAGDTVVEIDGQVLHGLPLAEVLRKVRGPAGSVMTISLRDGRTDRLKHLKVRRQVITVPPVRYLKLDNGIGYLRIVNFQHNTAIEVKKALTRLRSGGIDGLRGLILDLRDNPGGLFNEAIQVADQFLPSGVITSVRGRNRQLGEEFRATPKAGFHEIPLVILINKGTASASEILTGALQGRPNVVVMGDKSFGKASVQAVYPLRKGTALRLTTAHYYTADGRDIEGKGLEPDIRADVTLEGLAQQKVDLMNKYELEHDKGVRDAVAWLRYSRTPTRSPFPDLF
jgi:carboxyl-terminal processing protease